MIIFTRVLLLVMIGIMIPISVLACDVCGCSAGGTYFGILPQFHKHFIGIQYYYRKFETQHTSIADPKEYTSDETFKTIELRMRVNITRKLQLLTFLPFVMNKQVERNITNKIEGFGDATLIANYSLYNNGDSLLHVWKHNLQIGGGIKLPIGKYKQLNKDRVLNPYIQVGTGSADFILNTIYTIRRKKIGLNTNMQYRLTSTNTNNYKFGNKINLTSNLFYWANVLGFSILPNIGLSYEYAAKDKHQRILLPNSGGQNLVTTIGTDFYIKQLALALGYQHPMHQNNTIIKQKSRISTTLLINF
jgi:hypothetical protein